MGTWIQKNLKNIIVACFIVPILLIAFVSISHVTSMYEISNPVVWSAYLSIAIEIAALSALAAVSVRMGKFIYIPFITVTLIQILGNLFYSYSAIDETSTGFKNWVELITPIFQPMGVESTDIAAHKRIVAFFTGGILPFISLTFAHMLVVYTEKHKDLNEESNTDKNKEVEDIEELSKKMSKWEQEQEQEASPLNLNNEELEKLEEALIKKTAKSTEEVTSETNNQPPEESVGEIKTLRYTKPDENQQG